LIVLAGAARADDARPAAAGLPALALKSYYLVDHASGRVLAESKARERLPPASLTKLMTAYVVFKALEEKRIGLADEVRVSEKAWRQPGTRMFIEVNSRVRVEDLVRGMLIQSGNDASVALAEYVGGSFDEFLTMMNVQAAALGMHDSRFRNPTGLPAKDHYTTAHDLAILARALIAEFPQYYELYREREFSYNGIKQHNRNRLLWRDPSVDGMKTGHTAAAGYCIVTSAVRDGMRLIAVALGGQTANGRNRDTQALLDYGFGGFETHKLYSAGQQIVAERVWGGQPAMAALGLAQDLFVTIPRGSYTALSATLDYTVQHLVAPLASGTPVGQVHVLLEGKPLATMPVVALQQIAEGGMWTKVTDEIGRLVE
jgi:D-alanyl-D-alanine carboxypeptidase (penicillin-binding protein 5/6)